MPLKLNIGVSRKVGLPDYSSVGASCHLELELDAGLLERDLDVFHARVRATYIAAHQAVHDELARLQAPVEPEPVPPSAPVTNGKPAHRAPAPKPATPKQVQAIRALARRHATDLDDVLAQEFGVARPEDLTLAEASRLIDLLKSMAAV